MQPRPRAAGEERGQVGSVGAIGREHEAIGARPPEDLLHAPLPARLEACQGTARLGILEVQHALLAGLRSGKVAGAALDVMETEPLPDGHPLASFDNVMFGSHNASNTLEASARVHDVAIAHLIDELTSRS